MAVLTLLMYGVVFNPLVTVIDEEFMEIVANVVRCDLHEGVCLVHFVIIPVLLFQAEELCLAPYGLRKVDVTPMKKSSRDLV